MILDAGGNSSRGKKQRGPVKMKTICLGKRKGAEITLDPALYDKKHIATDTLNKMWLIGGSYV